MFKSSLRYQRGQAMSEFVIATAALLLPLMLGMIYISKYSDIKHQAIQASRFAAFEHAIDPRNEDTAPTGVLPEEVRARFFADASQVNGGKIGYQDNTSQIQASSTLNPMWYEVDGSTPMVTNYSDVAVTFAQGSFDSPSLTATDLVAKTNYNLDSSGTVQATVNVPVVNIAHFAPLSSLNLNIGATTVVAGDAWNAGGAADVQNHFTLVSIPGSLLKPLTQPLDAVFQLLSSTDGPQWGCVNADAVPADHLSNYSAPAPCTN